MTVTVFLDHAEYGTRVSFIGSNYSIYFTTGTEIDEKIRKLIGRIYIEKFSVDGNILYCSIDDYYHKTNMKACTALVDTFIKYPVGNEVT